MECAYCRTERGATTDHLITKNQAKRNIRAARERENPRYKVPACANCNVSKYTLLRVPVGFAFKAELEALTGDVYGEYDGTPASLRARDQLWEVHDHGGMKHEHFTRGEHDHAGRAV